MSSRIVKAALGLAVALIVAAGAFALGRASIDRHAARESGLRDGRSAGYFDGLRAGEATGRQEGRALQAQGTGAAKDAFNAGYVAGVNDAFAGYDGGWTLSTPYVITLEHGGPGIVYRISSRVAVRAGVNYYLCPNGHDICEEPRR